MYQADLDCANDCRPLAKCWWGSFTHWLEKLTTIYEAEKGDLPLNWADIISIFRARWGCLGKTWSVNLCIDLEAELVM